MDCSGVAVPLRVTKRETVRASPGNPMASPKEPSEVPKIPSSKRAATLKDAYWFKHDANASSDPKIELLEIEHGNNGYAFYFKTIEILRSQDSYNLPKSVISLLQRTYNLDIEQLGKILESCIKLELLVELDDIIYSPSLNKRMAEMDRLRKARSQGGKKGMAKRWQQKQQVSNSAITSDNDKIRSDKKRLDKSKLTRDLEELARA